MRPCSAALTSPAVVRTLAHAAQRVRRRVISTPQSRQKLAGCGGSVGAASGLPFTSRRLFCVSVVGCRHRRRGFSIVDDNILATLFGERCNRLRPCDCCFRELDCKRSHQSAIAVSLFEKPFTLKSLLANPLEKICVDFWTNRLHNIKNQSCREIECLREGRQDRDRDQARPRQGESPIRAQRTNS